MADRARWLLLTHEGRVVFVVVYAIAAVASILTYTARYGIGYGVGQIALLVFAPFWARWCMSRKVTPR